jgi:HEAT repeat protein
MAERLVKGKFILIPISLVMIFMICTSALGQVQTKDVAALIKNLKDNDGDVHFPATIALGNIGKPAAEPLIQVLKDNDSQVRSSAVDVLGQIKDTRVVET